MEDVNNAVSQMVDNSEKNQPIISINIVEDISLDLENDIQQLQEFEVILNNKQSDFYYENEILDEINDIISDELFNNEELIHDHRKIAENVSNAEFVSNINTISNTDEEMDVISISSSDSRTSSGYRTSDFEFISEVEAKRDCLIIHFKSNMKVDDPGEGTSGTKVMAPSILDKYIDRSSNTLKYRTRPSLNFADRAYRNNHGIPEGDDYFNLFRGIYDPMLQEIRLMENKSIKSTVMSLEYDGIGFDNQLIGKPYVRDSSDDEFEDEAKDNAKRILSMYPRENIKRRRRY